MNRLKFDTNNINFGLALTLAIACFLIKFSVWCSVGNHAVVLNFLSVKFSVLPMWLFALFDFLSFSILGFSLGADLSVNCASKEVSKYRGAFYFVIALTLICLSHLFLFKSLAFFLSLLMTIFALVCLFAAILDFYYVSSIAFLSVIIGALWNVYLVVFSALAAFSV